MIRELLADPIVIALLVLIGCVAGAWFGWYLRGTVTRSSNIDLGGPWL